MAILMLPINCGDHNPNRDTANDAQQVQSAPEPELVENAWHKNERIVESALNGVTVNEGFLEASIFFEELTGIAIRGEGTTLGWLPNAQSENDFRRIQAWHEENKHRLYWDYVHKKVKVHPLNLSDPGGQEAPHE